MNRAIETLGLTRIIIAHRPDTISSAQRCLVVVDSTVREMPRRNARPDVTCVTPRDLHAAVA